MLRGRLALASVYLCLACLLALPPQPVAVNLCTQDIIKKVQNLISKAPELKQLGCRLYTPTIMDYQNCPSSAMKCFADELKVLIEEGVTIPGIRSFRFNIKLAKLASQLNRTKSECLQCELLKEEEVETFLKGLQVTLEMMNMEHCSAVTTRAPPKNFQKTLHDPFSSS